MKPEDIATNLIAALKEDGHWADHVHNSPVWAVNVWLDDAGRIPNATVTVDDDGFTWGHSWEHSLPPGTPFPEVIAKIKETA